MGNLSNLNGMCKAAGDAALGTKLNAIINKMNNHCVEPPNFEISTNFDVQNGDAFHIIADGVPVLIATDQAFDTGTDTVIATNAYHAAGLLSIDADGTTYCQWTAEAETEAAVIALLAGITPTGDVVCGYVTVHAKAGQDFVAGTDALEGGSGGQVSQDTNYSNDGNVGSTAVDVFS